MKYIIRIIVCPFIFGLLLVTHLLFVLKRTYKFICAGGEFTLNSEKNG